MTNDDYGRRVSLALKAVRQLHDDTSRLLQDCDGTVGKGKTLATKTNGVTKDTFWALGKRWMPEGAFRCYAADPPKQPGLVDAVCVAFQGEKTAIDEPLLIVGRYAYRMGEGMALQDVCDGWDLWYLLDENPEPRPTGVVLAGGPIEWKEKTVESFRLVAVPLFTVASMDDVVNLMERVRAAGG